MPNPYPATPAPDRQTVLIGDDGISFEANPDGTIQDRVNFAATQFAGSIVHRPVTFADVTTIRSFYSANRLDGFLFTWKGVTYLLYFTETPGEQFLAGGFWEVQVPVCGTVNV